MCYYLQDFDYALEVELVVSMFDRTRWNKTASQTLEDGGQHGSVDVFVCACNHLARTCVGFVQSRNEAEIALVDSSQRPLASSIALRQEM
jgi:hypothetical protein